MDIGAEKFHNLPGEAEAPGGCCVGQANGIRHCVFMELSYLGSGSQTHNLYPGAKPSEGHCAGFAGHLSPSWDYSSHLDFVRKSHGTEGHEQQQRWPL